jgi:hypothetical protein
MSVSSKQGKHIAIKGKFILISMYGSAEGYEGI